MSVRNLVPIPRSVTTGAGEPFAIQDSDKVTFRDEGTDRIGAHAGEAAVAAAGKALGLEPGNGGEGDGRIALVINPGFNAGKAAATRAPEEAYRIEVSAEGITVTAGAPQGLQRGIATLAQLVETNRDGTHAIPQCLIEDSPRYGWRGISMDVARCFYPVPEIKRLIDLLAFYRMNTLHLHLSDDQGWRLEVASMPRLTEVSGATAGNGNRAGFYTTEDFAEIVRYAAERGINVIPEFDVPGHTNAATHAYGELQPDGVPTDAYGGTKVGFSLLHPSAPFTKTFLNEIFDAAALATPGEYVHLGGDEAHAQSAQDYKLLVEEAAAAVSQTGKKVVGWQEVAVAELPEDAVIQYWDTRADKDAIVKSVQAGHKVLMSPAPHAYLDMQYDKQTPYGQDWAGLVELTDSYNWDPATVLQGVDERSVVGVEAGMWTESIRDFDQLMYMLLPRLPALAEVAWSDQGQRDWADFSRRIADHSEYWDHAGLWWHGSRGVGWVAGPQ